MYTKLFINDFVTLGNLINPAFSDNEEYLLSKSDFNNSFDHNSFFTRAMQLKALEAVCSMFLKSDELNLWLSEYKNKIKERDETVALIMAGNIPLVGFHDFLSVLASGYKAEVKLSSKDRILLHAIIELLFSINSYWKSRISVVPELNITNKYKYVIAAGSDETVEAISKKFCNSTLLLRGSRSSVALLSGEESDDVLKLLGEDVFTYFGLGCRSISSLFVPFGYNLNRLSEAFSPFRVQMLSNESYSASYIQKRAILTLNNSNFFDGGFFLLANFEKMPPPLGCINLHYYENIAEVTHFLITEKDNIQAVCSDGVIPKSVKPGQMQFPALTDYADGIKTLDFLLNNF